VRTLLKFTIWFFSVIIFITACISAYFWYVWSSNLPYIGSLKEYRPPIITEVYSDTGELIGRFWEEKRIVVSLDRLPPHLVHAFIAAEDARFYEHEGLDIFSIFRAFLKNLKAGRIEQGGSTITQQVTKSLLLKNTERTYRRKAREALLSIQLEKNFSKEQILFLYLNQIYLGQGAYGVEAAARTYFNKPARDLSLAESALLAGLPQAPARYSPVDHFDLAKSRQRYVLQRMHKEGYINDQELKNAIEESLGIQADWENPFQKAPYFTEHVRRYLLKEYGRDLLYRGGLKVYTTLSLSAQEAAKDAVRAGLADLDKREGFRGPLRHLTPEEAASFREKASKELASSPPGEGDVLQGLVQGVDDSQKEALVTVGDLKCRLSLSEMEWARKPNPDIPYYATKVRRISRVLKPGDVVLVRLLKRLDSSDYGWEVSLEQVPEVQGALLCMIPETGEVKAMVGGRDFASSQFNRAVQSRRQPGSAFKPLIYAAALDWGMSPGKILIDAPYISEANTSDEVWKPKNYKERFFGPTLFRTALAKSRNVITVKILRRIGVDHAVAYANRMGIESELSPDLSLALGSSGVSLLEMTRAYAVFANGGRLVKPIFIKQVVDRNGNIIEENQPEALEVISKETAYVMTDLLKAVIKEGTGWRARALKRPAAGKTGTTNDLRDAWFIGYTPGFVAGVWVGYDDQKTMGKGETGSRAASPIWIDFFSRILDGKPVREFPVPEGIVFAKIDSKTGLLASPHSEESVFQAFKEGTEPKRYSPEPQSAKSGQFFQFDMGATH